MNIPPARQKKRSVNGPLELYSRPQTTCPPSPPAFNVDGEAAVEKHCGLHEVGIHVGALQHWRRGERGEQQDALVR